MKRDVRLGWCRRGISALVLMGCLGSAYAADFLGIAYPLTDITLSVRVAGVVERTRVRVGQPVKANALLLELAAQPQAMEVARRQLILDERSEVKSGQQRVAILKSMLADAEGLLRAGGVISQEEVRKMRLEVVIAEGDLAGALADEQRQKAELDLAKAELDQYTLRAPVAGVITDFTPQVGEWVAPGDAIVRLVDASVCEVRVKVSPLAAGALQAGDRFDLTIQDPKQPFAVSGKLTFVSPVADAASSLVDVRIRVDNRDGRIRPGSKASLELRGVN